MELGKPRNDNRSTIVRVALAGAFAGALAAGAVSWYVARQEAEKAKLRPPVAIIDFAALIARGGETPRSAEDLDRRMLQVKRAVQKLRDVGFLVLDSQSVLGAPELLYVPADRLD